MTFLGKQEGVAAIEFAILVPLIVLMVFGITEFGRALYQYNALGKSVRDGVRYLSTQAPGTGHGVAACLAVYGNQTCTGPVLAPGLNLTMVSICDAISCPGTHASVSTGSGVVNLATVTVTGFPFTSLVNFNLAGMRIGAQSTAFGPISATMRQEL